MGNGQRRDTNTTPDVQTAGLVPKKLVLQSFVGISLCFNEMRASQAGLSRQWKRLMCAKVFLRKVMKSPKVRQTQPILKSLARLKGAKPLSDLFGTKLELFVALASCFLLEAGKHRQGGAPVAVK